jgi:hypothetical protein
VIKQTTKMSVLGCSKRPRWKGDPPDPAESVGTAVSYFTPIEVLGTPSARLTDYQI